MTDDNQDFTLKNSQRHVIDKMMAFMFDDHPVKLQRVPFAIKTIRGLIHTFLYHFSFVFVEYVKDILS